MNDAIEFVRVRDVMTSLNVSYATVRRWIGKGELDAIRLPSGQFRVARRALDAIRHGGADM